jgi:type VI secretion system protein ImpK
VRIRGDNLFDSGSAEINSDYLPVLRRIAEALNSTDGAVVITGHTDDRRIFSPRFPSNWHLSYSRAEAVVIVLSGALAVPSRLRSEGRADREPIASNDSAESRAQNRRVDITVFPAPAGVTAEPGGRPFALQR